MGISNLYCSVIEAAPTQVGEDPLVWEKETIYTGDFEDGDKRPFSVDEQDINHWHSSVKEQIDAGLQITVPIEHTDDPEKNRGDVIGSRIGPNDKGLTALFTTIKFRDAEAAKMAKSVNVSLYSPAFYKDGKGKLWPKPLRHVALTTNPVIPGLSPFKAIVCSLVKPRTLKMSLNSLAEKLGIGVADKEEPAIEAEIKSLFDDMTRTIEDLKKGKTEEDPEEEVAASLVSTVKELRTMKLDKLVGEGRVSKAAADKLRLKHLSAETLKLSLKKGATDDGFDDLLAALSLNEPSIAFKASKTGTQVLPKAGDDAAGNAGLLANAKKRADARKR